MKPIVLLLAGLIIPGILNAQNLEWAKQLGGTGQVEGRSIAVDSWGNVYTTGRFSGTADFDPGPGTYNLTSAWSYDIFISKLDANGNFQWAKRIGGDFNNYGASIAVDAWGNVYTTGGFWGTSDFDPGPGTYLLTSTGNADIFISKLDSSGNFLWAKSMGGTSWDEGNSIAVDAVGNVYTTGSFRETVDFDPGPGSYNLTPAGSWDIFISKLDSSGNFLWARSMGGTSGDVGNSIAVDAGGNVYTTGWLWGTADFDPGPGTYTLTSVGLNDIYISKLDANGNFLWAKSMGGTSFDEGLSIAVDTMGNVYTTGYFYGTVDFDPGSGTYNLTSANFEDIFISKLDANGNFLWAKSIGGTSEERGSSIALDAEGNVYTTGWFSGTADFDPGPGTYNLTSAGEEDFFISKLDANGNFLWAGRMGGPNSDWGSSIAVDVGGNIYTTGRFFETADFDPEPGTFNLSSVGGWDGFVHKMNQCTTPAISANATITHPPCFGDSGAISLAPLHGTAPYSYVWSTSSSTASVSGLAAGQYDVTIKDSLGCARVNSFIIAAPSALGAATNTTKSQAAPNCTGTASMSPSGGTPPYTYSWSNGSVGSSLINVCPGTYHVTVVDSNGCTFEDSVVVEQAVGIGWIKSPAAIIVYPNPNTGQFTIGHPALEGLMYEVTDITGSVAQSGKLTGSETIIDLSHQPSGMYLLKTEGPIPAVVPLLIQR